MPHLENEQLFEMCISKDMRSISPLRDRGRTAEARPVDDTARRWGEETRSNAQRFKQAVRLCFWGGRWRGVAETGVAIFICTRNRLNKANVPHTVGEWLFVMRIFKYMLSIGSPEIGESVNRFEAYYSMIIFIL